MLQDTKTSNHPPQMLTVPPRQQRASNTQGPRNKKPTLQSVVRAEIMPIGDEADLLDLMCHLQERNDIGSAIALYQAYSAIADTFNAAINQPRTKDLAAAYIEDEASRAWAKAYLVADFLKDMRPNKINVDFYAEVLLACASQMGATLSEIAAIATEIAVMPLDGPSRIEPREQR